MTFLAAFALLVAALVGLPIAAHFLRRGRAEEHDFPPARLVQTVPPVARRRVRTEDRALLAIRAAMVALLAVLGASPFVRCSQLSLSRGAGASVALAIVLDDSLSMRTSTDGGGARWEIAHAAARDLLDSARTGDSVAVVLAGRPARVALGATRDLGAVREVLARLEPSDRSTDLAAAVTLAASVITDLPQPEKRIALLSDLAGELPRSTEVEVWAPLERIRTNVPDCGIAAAERRGQTVTVALACNSTAAARGRRVELARSDASSSAVVAALPSAGIEARPGLQTIALSLSDEGESRLFARLVGGDALEYDDTAPVSTAGGSLTIGVVYDPASASVSTGGPSVIEQALVALGKDATVRPMALLPDALGEFERLSAVVIDDPPGLAADARATLTEWLESGRVAVALVGPRAEKAPLGATLEPFAAGAVPWEETKAKGIAASSMAWLGREAKSLSDISRGHRARLDGAGTVLANVVGRWDDDAVFALETRIGRGTAFAIGLPSSIDRSDLALRPGFLAILDHVLSDAGKRAGPRVSEVGTTWTFDRSVSINVTGPRGPLALTTNASETLAEPPVRGRYTVEIDGAREERTVTLDATEILEVPRAPEESLAVRLGDDGRAFVDASPDVALGLLVLFAVELGVRFFQRRRRAGERRRVQRTPAGV